MAIQTPIVRFRDIQKSYDGQLLIVKNLNLDIRQGEFLTLLGPSGSGKSTCLMMLAGFETPTHGEISLNGAPLNKVPPHHRNIGMVFQNYALFPHMTVLENLMFPLSVRKMNRTDARQQAQDALDMVKLGDFATRYPAQLSGGQQQRVALARALVFKPELVLMDEPLGALDKQLREHMQMEIKHIHENLGVTIVYVTHDQSEALTMSDRIAIFNDGIIQQIDDPRTIYEQPANSFVAQFIGENNTLPCTVQHVDTSYCHAQLSNAAAIVTRSSNHCTSGASASLSIRPERLRLQGFERDNDNRLDGHVEEFIYLGDHVRIRTRVADNDNFIVKVPISDFDTDLKTGDTLPLFLSPDDAHALDPISS